MPTYMLVTLLLVPSAAGQETSAIPARLIIPGQTPVQLQLGENVSSAHARPGDRLNFIVARDVNIEGFTVIPAGAVASGSVTAVKGKRFLGIGGDVALKLDSVEAANGDRIGLHAGVNIKGRSRTRLMAAAMIATGLIFLPATPVLLLIRGQDSTVLRSTKITGYTDADTLVLSAHLRHSQELSSELDTVMDYLPPRVFNAEGRQGDMLNLVFVGQRQDVENAFKQAGWVETDKWTPIFVWHLLLHGIYDATVPMARFYLFGRVQDYSYALPQPGAIVSRRHHLRIWQTDHTINGTPIWVASATHDVAIEVAKRARLINHRIDPDVDAERDFVGTDLTKTSAISRQEYLQSANPVFHAETVSGQAYHSDSRILLLNLYPLTSAKTGTIEQPSVSLQTTSRAIPTPTAPLR